MSEDAHFTARLPAKRVAADCLFVDQAGRVLVLEPTYKPTWDLPGGVVEADESPRRGVQREVREEIGLDVEPGRLIAVDWKGRDGAFTEVIALLFDGGLLASADVDRIVADASEVRSHRFVTLGEAERLLDAELFARVVAGLQARRSGATAYLENGLPPVRP